MFGNIAEMKAIEKPHKELHNVIKNILRLKEAGDMKAAEKAYENTGPLSSRIVTLLDEIEEKIS